MTWREGVNYWRAWARAGSTLDQEDAARIEKFYDACAHAHPLNLDDAMPPELVKQLGMDR